MPRSVACLFLLTLLCSAGPQAASLCEQQRSGEQTSDKKPQSESRQEDPPRWKWWLHADSRRELRLTDTQSRKINEIWDATAPKQREKMDELRRLEEALAKTIKENTADVAIVAQQVEKVEKLRAETNSTRTMMIYRMHLLLTPEQREKVDAMRKKFDEERKRRDEEQRREKKEQGQHAGRTFSSGGHS
jgi:Spy/CpxP family protein refolding chaperone